MTIRSFLRDFPSPRTTRLGLLFGVPLSILLGPRQAIARREALAPVATTLARLSRRLDDDLLAQGEKIREVTSPAYAILKANAPVDAGLRKRASRVFDYYAARGRPKKKPAGT